MEKIRIAFFDTKDYDREAFDALYDRKIFDISYFDTRLSTDTVSLAAGADAVCVFVNDNVDGEVISRLADMNVRLIALRCAGYNNVDIEKAYGRIHVVRVPAYSPYAVAEHAMALLLTSIRRIHKAYIRTRDFNFSLNGLTGFDLHGKTVGIVGLGKIGRVFMDICKGFGMNIIAYDRFPRDDGVEYVALNEIRKRSDIISFHCPLTDENRHMVNATTIAQMKKAWCSSIPPAAASSTARRFWRASRSAKSAQPVWTSTRKRATSFSTISPATSWTTTRWRGSSPCPTSSLPRIRRF